MRLLLCSSLCLAASVSFASAQSAVGKRSHAPKNTVLIPGATFQMGTDRNAIPELLKAFNVKRDEIFLGETPRHTVRIDSFYLDKFEVTNAKFRSFILKNSKWRKDKIPGNLQNGKYLNDWNGNDFPKGKSDFPVVNVSWYAAVAFCQSRRKRLPTEAEWEYSARGGLKDKAFPWGDEPPDKTRANFSLSGFGAAIKVGQYKPNGYGLYDMAGNVWEYLADEWAPYPQANEPLVNPVAGGDLFTRDSYLQITARRVIRGGSWGGSPINLRVTYRDSHPANGAGDHVGFRCTESIRR